MPCHMFLLWAKGKAKREAEGGEVSERGHFCFRVKACEVLSFMRGLKQQEKRTRFVLSPVIFCVLFTLLVQSHFSQNTIIF